MLLPGGIKCHIFKEQLPYNSLNESLKFIYGHNYYYADELSMTIWNVSATVPTVDGLVCHR
jgi:hypothetical protein